MNSMNYPRKHIQEVIFNCFYSGEFLVIVHSFCIAEASLAPVIDPRAVAKGGATEHSYASYINISAIIFLVAILTLIVIIVGVYRLQYRVYKKNKLETKSLCDSLGSSTDLSDYHPPMRFASLHTIAEVLSLASLPFNRRENSSNYTQLSDRNCVPLRSKPGWISMPSSPFTGRSPSSGAPPSFMRKKKRNNRLEKNRRSASCNELESKFIFPIQEEVMTSSISETELSSSKEDSGNESLKLSKKKSKAAIIKKPQNNKGNFAQIKKVKNLSPNVLKNSTNDKNGQHLRAKHRMKFNIRRPSIKDNGSPLTLPRMLSKSNVLASSASELSTAGADLEFDYYDYDMENASAVPGSLFGLDPTLMPWLPSILNINEIEDEETEIYSKHSLSVSQSTLTKVGDSKCEFIPMQDMGRSKENDEEDEGIKGERTPVSSQSTDLSASKAISLSSTDNSDEIPFADDTDEAE